MFIPIMIGIKMDNEIRSYSVDKNKVLAFFSDSIEVKITPYLIEEGLIKKIKSVEIRKHDKPIAKLNIEHEGFLEDKGIFESNSNITQKDLGVYLEKMMEKGNIVYENSIAGKQDYNKDDRIFWRVTTRFGEEVRRKLINNEYKEKLI